MDFTDVVWWIFLAIAAAFIGQFGRAFADWLIARARRRNSETSSEPGISSPPQTPPAIPEASEAQSENARSQVVVGTRAPGEQLPSVRRSQAGSEATKAAPAEEPDRLASEPHRLSVSEPTEASKKLSKEAVKQQKKAAKAQAKAEKKQ